MRIDETRHNHSAFGIDDSRTQREACTNLRRRADSNDAVAVQRDRLGPRLGGLTRPDCAVDDRDGGALGLGLVGGHRYRAGEEQRGDGEQDGRTHRQKLAKILRAAAVARIAAWTRSNTTRSRLRWPGWFQSRPCITREPPTEMIK